MTNCQTQNFASWVRILYKICNIVYDYCIIPFVGLDAFNVAISYWKKALHISTNSSSANRSCLTTVVEHAHQLQSVVKQVKGLRQTPSVLTTETSVVPQWQEKDDDEVSITSTDSFQSATGTDSEVRIILWYENRCMLIICLKLYHS